MSFYNQLVKETEKYRQELYSVPQLVDGLGGNISRETYIAYLTEAYHHVSHTVRFLMAMGLRVRDHCFQRKPLSVSNIAVAFFNYAYPGWRNDLYFGMVVSVPYS